MERNAKVTIPTTTQEKDTKGKEVTFYTVEINLEGSRWSLKKRFNDFHTLNDVLKKVNGNLPTMPGKSLLPVTNPSDIDKRRQGLEAYFQALSTRVDVYSNEAFVQFLALDQHKPDATLNPMEVVGKISHLLMGYRDVFFTGGRKMYFSCSSDPHSVSRIDSYITNMEMPWNKAKKEEVILAVGNLEAWVKVHRKTDDFYYERLWLKTFKSQAICMDYNQSSNLVAVGCDNGQVTIIQVNKSDQAKYTEIYDDKMHSARVMRLVIDDHHGCVYSIGEDKYLYVFDLQAKVLVHQVFISQKKLTEMIVDKKNRIAYIADRGGSIKVVSLHSSPPINKQSIKTSSNDSIRGLDADFENKKLFCCCYEDSYVYIYNITDPSDPEGRIEKLHTIKGVPQPRILKWWPDREEIFLGHEGGNVSVINYRLNKDGPIFSMKAHEGNVNCLQILGNEGMVISASGDKKIKVSSSYPSSGARQ